MFIMSSRASVVSASTHTVFAPLRLSVSLTSLPFLSLSSTPTPKPKPLQVRNFHCLFSSPRNNLHNSFLPTWLNSLNSLKPLMGSSSFTPKASLTTESSSEGGREILVQHLLLKADDLRLVVDLQKRIGQGEDLSVLATEYSICPSKDEGGMLGWVRKGQMVPEFEEAAFSAPLEKVVRCKSKFGWHLLQVVSEREEMVLKEVPPSELHEKLQDPKFTEEAQLIDVREPEEVSKSSLLGFKILPLQQFGSWAPEIMTQFDPNKDTYVMCHHGFRSMQVAKWLQSQGFKRVFNVAGGIHAYAVNVDPSVPTY